VVMNKAMSESDVVLDVRTDIEATKRGREGIEGHRSQASPLLTPTYTDGNVAIGRLLDPVCLSPQLITHPHPPHPDRQSASARPLSHINCMCHRAQQASNLREPSRSTASLTEYL